MVTPLVDVVFNLMITMFIFLMIYMAVVVPKPERKLRPLEFAKVDLPPASPYVEYHAAIPVGYGSGKFTFAGRSGLAPTQGRLQVGASDGLLSGVLLASALPRWRLATHLTIEAAVVDNEHTTWAPADLTVPWVLGTSNVHVCFHRELPLESRGQLEDLAPGEAPAADALRRHVVAHYAVRGRFNLRIKPVNVPFAPAEEPLRLTGAQTAKGVVGFPLEIPLGPMGGIEPYEYDISGAPTWLKLDERRAALLGVPPASGRFELTVRVKDGQTPTKDWRTAAELRDAPGHPLVSGSITVEVEPFHPLEAQFALPRFGRVGQPFVGAIVATGGVGKKRFSPVRLPAGLSSDADSGALAGTPVVKNGSAIEVRVQDDSTNVLLRTSEAHWRGVIDALPTTSILGGNPSP